jgi:acyl-CoA thioester hydrolase
MLSLRDQLAQIDNATKLTRPRFGFHAHSFCRSDNDVFGHMNNPYYGVLCDSIANEFLIRKCNYTMNRHPQAAIIVNTYFDYFGSVGYPGVIEVGLRVAKLGKSSVVYEVGVFMKGEEDVKAVGGSMHVWVDNDDGKLGRPQKDGMPKHVREAYETLMETEAVEESRREARAKL